MRLNLGCGNDVREGYLNIDLLSTDPSVTKSDVRNFAGIMVADNSVEEILALDIIQYISVQDFGQTMKLWYNKLQTGGKLIIHSVDANMLGLKMAFDLMSPDEINGILYAGGNIRPQSIYNLTNLETFLRNYGFSTVTKGYNDIKFFLEVTKK